MAIDTSRHRRFVAGSVDDADQSANANARGLVAAQVAIAAVLMVVAALVSLSQRNVLALDPGFDPDPRSRTDLSPPEGRFDTTIDATNFFEGLLACITALPGVESACVANEVPLDREPNGMTYVPEGAVRPISACPTRSHRLALMFSGFG